MIRYIHTIIIIIREGGREGRRHLPFIDLVAQDPRFGQEVDHLADLRSVFLFLVLDFKDDLEVHVELVLQLVLLRADGVQSEAGCLIL